MSAQDARKVISRAVQDETFRNQLFSNPDAALAEYSLDEQEISALRGIPAETIDDFANRLDERISMSLFAFGGEAMGGDAAGGSAMGGDAAGGSAMGGDAAGGSAYGGDAAGGYAAGGDAAGGEAAGGEAAGGEAAGGEAAGGGSGPVGEGRPTSWLERLGEALGIGSSGSSSDGSDYY